MAELFKLAAFCVDGKGGNPAGVWLGESFPVERDMRQMAAHLGYSETVFAVRHEQHWQVRYFSPESELPFCGHATIALGAALASCHGNGIYSLRLVDGTAVNVDGSAVDGQLTATLWSPKTSSYLDPTLASAAMALFGYSAADLDPRLPPAVICAGATHLLLALNTRERLHSMRYSLEAGRIFMCENGLATIALVYARNQTQFDCRNAFASGGVYEDPATGAAAAALSGYLRDLDWLSAGEIRITQGEDMGIPCRLDTKFDERKGSSVQVTGTVRWM